MLLISAECYGQGGQVEEGLKGSAERGGYKMGVAERLDEEIEI
jgi:hypothetical protein